MQPQLVDYSACDAAALGDPTDWQQWKWGIIPNRLGQNGQVLNCGRKASKSKALMRSPAFFRKPRHNVRELQNIIERAVILGDGDTLAVDETWLKGKPANPVRARALDLALVRQEKEMIEAALAESQGRVSGPAGAAAKLGLPARTLDSKIKRLKIKKNRFKAPRAH